MLFFDSKAWPRDPRLLLAEAAAVFLLIMLYIWRLRFEHPWFAAVLLGLIVSSHLWRGEAPADLGFRRTNLRTCLLVFAPVLLLACLLLVSAGFLLHTIRAVGFEPALLGFVSYCVWGLFQQYLLNGYFVNRLRPLAPSARHAAVAAGALFAGAHTPNWFLMAVAFGAGYCCARVYLKYRNLYFLGLAHGVIGFLLYLVVPDAVSHHLVVGPGFFGR